MFLYPFIFEPNTKRLVWGSEEWSVSAVPGSESVVANGPMQGRMLSKVIESDPEAILGREVFAKYGGMPLLAKIIDAKQDLSIQVHPNDEMAARLHNKMGKSEMWYVMEAESGAYLYAGFEKEITPEQYERLIADGSIVQVLAKHSVKRGDVFYLPAGRVHAICGGIKLAEVQQSSDVTYRIFDYNRPGLDGKPRELHTQLAAQALDYKVYPEYKREHKLSPGELDKVLDTPHFSIRVLEVDQPFHRNLIKYDSFFIVISLEGACTLRIRESVARGELREVQLQEGEAAFIPAAIADYDIIPDAAGAAGAGGGTGAGAADVVGAAAGAPRAKVMEAFINNRRSIMGMISNFLHIG